MYPGHWIGEEMTLGDIPKAAMKPFGQGEIGSREKRKSARLRAFVEKRKKKREESTGRWMGGAGLPSKAEKNKL